MARGSAGSRTWRRRRARRRRRTGIAHGIGSPPANEVGGGLPSLEQGILEALRLPGGNGVRHRPDGQPHNVQLGQRWDKSVKEPDHILDVRLIRGRRCAGWLCFLPHRPSPIRSGPARGFGPPPRTAISCPFGSFPVSPGRVELADSATTRPPWSPCFSWPLGLGVVGEAGLEPARPESGPGDFKSPASASSATRLVPPARTGSSGCEPPALPAVRTKSSPSPNPLAGSERQCTGFAIARLPLRAAERLDAERAVRRRSRGANLTGR